MSLIDEMEKFPLYSDQNSHGNYLLNTLNGLDSLNNDDLVFAIKSMSQSDVEKNLPKLLDIIKNCKDNYRKNQLIVALPPSLRLQCIDFYYFSMSYRIDDLVDGVVDEGVIYQIAKYALDRYPDGIDEYLKALPNSKKEEFLIYVSEREQEIKSEIISPYNIGDCLSCFPLEKRLDVLKRIFYSNFQTSYFDQYLNIRMGSRFFRSILSAFSEENNKTTENSFMFQALKFILLKSKYQIDLTNNTQYGVLCVGDIMKVFYKNGYDINLIIKELVKANNEGIDVFFSDIADYLPMNIRKTAIDFLMQCDNYEKNIITFYRQLDSLTFSDLKKLYIKYALNSNDVDYLYGVSQSKSEYLNYSGMDYLKIIFETWTFEKIDSEFENIMRSMREMEAFPEYDDKYGIIITIFSKKYDIDEIKIKKFITVFGLNFLKYFENENIIKLLKLDDESIDKLFALFDENTAKLDKSTINSIVNSLLQREFITAESYTYNIFAVFLNFIQNNNFDEVYKLLSVIIKTLKDNNKKLPDGTSVEKILTEIKNGNLASLHEITRLYIAFKREKFVQSNIRESFKSLDLVPVVSKESYKEYFILEDPFGIIRHCNDLQNVEFSAAQIELLGNTDLLLELAEFKKNPKTSSLSKEKMKKLKVLNELLDIMYNNKVDFSYFNPHIQHDILLKYDYIPGPISNDFLIGVLLEVNYDGLIKLLENEKDYYLLKDFISKYKIMGWENVFRKLLGRCDLHFDEATIAGFIGNFSSIKPLIAKNETLTAIIDKANCSTSFSIVYRQLFGNENCDLIVANPGKNKATMTKYNRLNGCKEIVPEMYSKEYFTVPTFNEVFRLPNGKSIQVILGNSTNMINLTYGERTDACMRMGGAFNSLFRYCATNENGFHVRIINPLTGGFVSRVSGLRNGNTIFLNELRLSLDDNYSNEDLYETIKLVANYIIEFSRGSDVPVDNVLITNDYALESHEKETISLELSPEEKTEALRGISFNFNNNGLLLATSNNQKEIIPYKFGDDLPKYRTIRDDAKTYFGQAAINRVIQIKIINGLLQGQKLEDIDTEFNGFPPDYVISGEDYYIYHANHVSEVFILESRKQNERTLEEIDYVLKNGLDFLAIDKRTM